MRSELTTQALVWMALLVVLVWGVVGLAVTPIG
jgi:hypothetical protein